MSTLPARPIAGQDASLFRAYYRLLRPTHWTKNAFVFAALLFSGHAFDPTAVLGAVMAFVAFCLAASAVYAFNDVQDRAADREHPIKRNRPVASGQISTTHASIVAASLATGALALMLFVDARAAALIALYLALNVAYSLRLKHVVLLDVFAIASFFVIRLLVGAAAVHVVPSIWLLLCGGLLALYLGFAKRRHELSVLGDASAGHRDVLKHYSPAFLDQISGVLLAVTIVSYLMYALTSDTAVRVGSDALGYGVPFVLFGVFRYLFLVHQRDLGSPTETVLSDRTLLATVTLWVLYSGWVLYRPH